MHGRVGSAPTPRLLLSLVVHRALVCNHRFGQQHAVQRTLLFFPDVASMVKELGKKGITVKDEPGLSLVRLFGPGVGDEKVNPTAVKNR